MKKYTSAAAIVAALLSVLFLSGCAFVSEGSPEAKKQALRFAPPPGKACIYIIRSTRFVGAAGSLKVFLDGPGNQSVTQAELAPIPWKYCDLPARSYAFCIVEPGQHTVAVYNIDNGFREEGGIIINGERHGVNMYYTGQISCSMASIPTIVHAEAGKNYYVKGFAVSPLPKHELVAEAEGQALVKSCKLSAAGNLPH
jgi:hypothetical protein